MLSKQELIQTLSWESTVTAKVIRALSAEKLELKPHGIARTAHELITTFTVLIHMMQGISKGALPKDPLALVEPFTTLEDGARGFEQAYRQLITTLQATDEEEFTKSFNFFEREITRGEAITTLLFDSIHHRGQYSVYVRMTGGTVPAIYSFTGDEGTSTEFKQ